MTLMGWLARQAQKYVQFRDEHPEVCLATATAFCCVIWMVPTWRIPDYSADLYNGRCVRNRFLQHWGTLLTRIVVTVKPGKTREESFSLTLNSALWLFMGTCTAALWAHLLEFVLESLGCDLAASGRCMRGNIPAIFVSAFFFIYFLEKVLWFGSEPISLFGDDFKVDWNFQTWAISSHAGFMMTIVDPGSKGFREDFLCQSPTIYLSLAFVGTIFALYTVEAAYNFYALLVWILIAVASLALSDHAGLRFYYALAVCTAYAVAFLAIAAACRRRQTNSPRLPNSSFACALAERRDGDCKARIVRLAKALRSFIPFYLVWRDCCMRRCRREDSILAHFWAITTAFVIGWSGLLIPALPPYDDTMAVFIAMLIWQPGKPSSSCENGKKRWLGATIGPLVGFVLLTSFYECWPVLLCLAFFWELLMLYVFYKTKNLPPMDGPQRPRSRYRILRIRDKILNLLLSDDGSTARSDKAVLPFALIAAFSPSYMITPGGRDPWAKAMTNDQGIGWALAENYRKAIGQFMAVAIMMAFEIIFSFFIDDSNSHDAQQELMQCCHDAGTDAAACDPPSENSSSVDADLQHIRQDGIARSAPAGAASPIDTGEATSGVADTRTNGPGMIRGAMHFHGADENLLQSCHDANTDAAARDPRASPTSTRVPCH